MPAVPRHPVPQNVLEMERRTAERQRRRSDLRRMYEEREAEKRRAAEEQEAEKAQQEATQRRRKAMEHLERRRLEIQREEQIRAERQRYRENCQLAQRHWTAQRLAGAFCFWRALADAALEREVVGLRRARRRILIRTFASLLHAVRFVQAEREAAARALVHQADKMVRRRSRRLVFSNLKAACAALASEREDRAAAGAVRRKALLAKELLGFWQHCTAAEAFRKNARATVQFARWVLLRGWERWKKGILQAKSEARLEAHKQEMWSKVNGWIAEMDKNNILSTADGGS